MKCCKCGGEGIGPRWNKLTDKLDYSCAQCGYCWDTPCMDKQRKDGFVVNVLSSGRTVDPEAIKEFAERFVEKMYQQPRRITPDTIFIRSEKPFETWTRQ